MPDTPTPDAPRVAVLGLGTMGAAMAARLVDAGMEVHGWNRSPGPANALAERGASAHAEPHHAVAAADVVITMLPTPDALRSVIDSGVMDAFRPGAVWAQMGTIGAAATDKWTAEVATRRADVDFVDAPVSGSRAPAESGQLLILAAGSERAAAVLSPVFGRLGHRTIWLGVPGEATRLKLILNTWLAFLVEGAAETSALAQRLGVPQTVLVDALAGGPLASGLAMAKMEKMDRADDHADFSLQWALKDIDLALDSAGPTTLPVARAISARWQDLVDDGLGELDVSAARHGLGASDAPTSADAPPGAS